MNFLNNSYLQSKIIFISKEKWREITAEKDLSNNYSIEIIEKQLVKYLPMEFKYSKRTSFKQFFDPMNSHNPDRYKAWLHAVWKYTDKMNKIRGFDILDHVPELKKELQKL